MTTTESSFATGQFSDRWGTGEPAIAYLTAKESTQRGHRV